MQLLQTSLGFLITLSDHTKVLAILVRSVANPISPSKCPGIPTHVRPAVDRFDCLTVTVELIL